MSLATMGSTGSPRLSFPHRKRWTVAEFHQLRSAEWLESRRSILVEGEILEVPSPDPPHDASLGLAEDALRGVFGRGVWVRGQMALVLGLATDPVPDLAVVQGHPRASTEHPRSALLVVEIAESSLAYDCGDKADLYAAGSVREYWVVDPVHRQVVVHRDPASDPVRLHGAKYQSVTTVGGAGEGRRRRVLHARSTTAVVVFNLFAAVVLGISFYLGSRARSAKGYYAAHGTIPCFVNGIAFAGDYLSAASFPGICGMIAFWGYDRFLYTIGYLAGWIVALFVWATPPSTAESETAFRVAPESQVLSADDARVLPETGGWRGKPYVRVAHADGVTVWRRAAGGLLWETQHITVRRDGSRLVGGRPHGRGEGQSDLRPVGHISRLPGDEATSGPVGPPSFFSVLAGSEIILWGSETIAEEDGSQTTIYHQRPTSGRDVLVPGSSPTLRVVRGEQLTDKLDFLSLTLALFCGRASLPHILIRYYTVRDQPSARRSTVVGIASIGFF